jgi:hypothetical protein
VLGKLVTWKESGEIKMAKRSEVITRTFKQRGKTIIVSTDSVAYMEEQAKIYSKKDKE